MRIAAAIQPDWWLSVLEGPQERCFILRRWFGLLHFDGNDEEGVRTRGALPNTE
jgi:hypothetical protein